MDIVPFVLQLLALLCLIFAAMNLFPPIPPRTVPIWFPTGMFLWLLSLMLNAHLHAAGAAVGTH